MPLEWHEYYMLTHRDKDLRKEIESLRKEIKGLKKKIKELEKKRNKQ